MKVALKDIVMMFEEMEGELNISYVSIVIFVGVDVDSVCTLKMLSVHFFLARKCLNAKTSSIKSIQSPPTRTFTLGYSSLASTIVSKCLCSSTVVDSLTLQNFGLSSSNRQTYSFSTFISPFITKIYRALTYLLFYSDQNSWWWVQSIRVLSDIWINIKVRWVDGVWSRRR